MGLIRVCQFVCFYGIFPADARNIQADMSRHNLKNLRSLWYFNRNYLVQSLGQTKTRIVGNLTFA